MEPHSTSLFGGITMTESRPRKTSSILPSSFVHMNRGAQTHAQAWKQMHSTEALSTVSFSVHPLQRQKKYLLHNGSV